MKLFYLVFVLVFSSLLIGVTAVYASSSLGSTADLISGTSVTVTGKLGNGEQTTGGNKLSTVNSPSFDGTTGTISYGGWYYPTGFTSQARLIDHPYTSHTFPYYDWYLQVNANSGNKALCGNTGNSAQSTSTIQLNQWNHIVCTNDGTTLKVYVNGQLESSSLGAFNPQGYHSALYLGALGNVGNNYYSGTHDEVFIFERSLDQNEISALYNSGNANRVDSIDHTGLMVYYDFDDNKQNQADVVDTTSPIITLTGNNPQSIELGNGYTELGATTDDGSAVTIDSSTFVDSLGSYNILYNSVDSSGNNAIQVTRTVNVVDSTPDITPPLIIPPPNMTLESTDEQTIVNIGTATATDDKDPNPTITSNTPSIFPLGITTITWTATDYSGNESTAIQTVTISDPRKPTQGEIPLNELDNWIMNHGGIYFGIGIFTFGFIIIGVMASPKTVPIFTIMLMILSGLLHVTGIFILPAWFWGIIIILAITLTLKRKK